MVQYCSSKYVRQDRKCFNCSATIRNKYTPSTMETLMDLGFLEFDNFLYAASAASTITLLAATCYYYVKTSEKPEIHTSNDKLRRFLESHVPSIFKEFSPSWLFWEGRLQSIMGLALRLPESKKLPYTREVLQLSDGGQLGLDYLEPVESPAEQSPKKACKGGKGSRQKNGKKGKDKLVVILMPGLTSTSQTSYVKSVALAITHAGATVVVLNNRGLGGVPLKTPKTYCASKPDDAREVIAHVRQKFPNTRLMAVGCSLGGMLLCQYLINYAKEAKETLAAALVISICWDPMAGTMNLEKPFVNKYIVNQNLTQNLRQLVSKYREILDERNCWDWNKILKARTLREFDASFTAPGFGYASVTDYYNAASLIEHVHKFPIPVFGLNSVDDPLQPGEYLPVQEAQKDGSNLAMIVTQRGGHLGFVETAIPRPFHYMERFVIDLVRAVRLHSEDLM